MPLNYVNIGITGKGIGTVSDSQGNFKLQLNEKIAQTDTIVFSHIGYETKRIPVAGVMSNTIWVKLKPLSTKLDEVVVTYKKSKAKKLGRRGKGLGLMHQNFYSYYEKDVDDRLSKEMGVRLPIKKDCDIEALNFNITSNDFKSLKFRINFYRIEKGLPG